jgi:hypothetical protein
MIGSALHLPYNGEWPLLAAYDGADWELASASERHPFPAQLSDAQPKQNQLIIADHWPVEIWGQDDNGGFTLKLGEAEELILNASPAGGLEIHSNRKRVAQWHPDVNIWRFSFNQLERFCERLIIHPSFVPLQMPGPRSRPSALAERGHFG